MKPVHMAHQVNRNGGVSALCFAQPRPIRLSVATWTLLWRFVTCKKCLKLKGEPVGAPDHQGFGEKSIEIG